MTAMAGGYNYSLKIRGLKKDDVTGNKPSSHYFEIDSK